MANCVHHLVAGCCGGGMCTAMLEREDEMWWRINASNTSLQLCQNASKYDHNKYIFNFLLLCTYVSECQQIPFQYSHHYSIELKLRAS